ncbi:hypothetical protein [Cupriavidus necator]
MKKLAATLFCATVLITGHALAQETMKTEAMTQATGMAKDAMKRTATVGMDSMKDNAKAQPSGLAQALESEKNTTTKSQHKHKAGHKKHGKKMAHESMAN